MKGLFIAAATFILTISASAQNYQLPDRHALRHDALLANQGNAGISVENTTKYLEELFEEEEEPELDIYTEGWDSQAVNCYNAAQVPQTAVIDVTNFAMPHPGYITSPYGYRRRFRRMHKGVDLKLNIGDTVRAAFDGKVRIVRNQGARKGYGMYVVIRHPNQLETVYGHLSKWLVEPDQYVKAGDPIALGGNTGRSTGPHLHFETRYMGYAINPCAIFRLRKPDHAHRHLYLRQEYLSERAQLLARGKLRVRQRVSEEKSGQAVRAQFRTQVEKLHGKLPCAKRRHPQQNRIAQRHYSGQTLRFKRPQNHFKT